MHSTRPSFLNVLKSIFECFMSQDLQLVNLNENNEPYLFSHNYGDMDIENDKKLAQFKSSAFSNRSYESSSSSEVELLRVERIEKRELRSQQSADLGRNENDSLNNKKIDDKIPVDKQIKETNPVKLDDLKSNVFKIDSRKDSQLINKLSSSFLSWPTDKKEKYVDQLMKSALKYIQLKDYERAEMVLFELLDILFYCSKNLKNIPKSIEILKILDGIYLETDRHLEIVEVNKLIATICYSFYGVKTDEVECALNKIVLGYRKMKLDHKAQMFIDELNRKIKK